MAAQAEQIYEYAAQCLDAVAKAGMIGQSGVTERSGDLAIGRHSAHAVLIRRIREDGGGPHQHDQRHPSDLKAVGQLCGDGLRMRWI